MAEVMTAAEKIKMEVKLRFVGLVFKGEMHPQDAAEKMGIPYHIFLAAKEHDPALAICWEDIEARALAKTKGRRKSVLEYAEGFIADLVEVGGLHQKIIRMCQQADPATVDGRKTIRWLVQYGVLRDTLPHFTAATIEHKNATVDKHASHTTGELIRMLEDKVGSAIRIQLEGEFATKQRLELQRDAKVSDAEFRHVQGGDHPAD